MIVRFGCNACDASTAIHTARDLDGEWYIATEECPCGYVLTDDGYTNLRADADRQELTAWECAVDVAWGV